MNILPISRRDFLKISLMSASLLPFWKRDSRSTQLTDWPQNTALGRNCTAGTINIRSRPSADSLIINTVYEDTVFLWEKEVVGQAPPGLFSRKWIQTPEGYIYAPSLQPCKYLPNVPVSSLQNTSFGPGMWVEVTVPFVDIYLANPPARAPWLSAVQYPRLYFGQIIWIDELSQDASGKIMYRIKERTSYEDIFWAEATAFKPLTDGDFAPINPEVNDKQIVVNATYQYLSCLEEGREVYFCRVSTGSKINAEGQSVDTWATPLGEFPINRKLASLHMSGGSSGNGYDTPGIGWTSLFAPGGVAIHSTFWHNDFGVARSHGCVNVLPEDAKWIFRWTQPLVPYDPGDVTVQMPGGTKVKVIQPI